MPFNIFGVLEEIKNEYDVNTEERKALSIIENRLYENKKLKKQLKIATNTLKEIYSNSSIINQDFSDHNEMARIALEQIKELEQ